MTVQKWGGLASFLLAATYIVPGAIYLVGDLRTAMGPFSYSLADFLYGPVWATSLITAVVALRERLDEHAPRRMHLALLAALLAAGAMVAVACIRSANRHYHITHPDMHLEESATVLIVWATLVAGMSGAGFHFLGWLYGLLGWVGWTSRRLHRGLIVLYGLAALSALFVYVRPDWEGNAMVFSFAASIWQGIVLWRNEGKATQPSEPIAALA